MMGYKTKLWAFLIVSVLGEVAGYILVHPERLGICLEKTICFSNFLVFRIGEPLLFGFIPLIITTVILFFFSEQIFKSWFKFAIVFIPLAVLAIIFLPTDEGGFGLPAIITKETITLASSVIYLIGSFFIILIKSLKLRKT
jgi:hypothetical protein